MEKDKNDFLKKLKDSLETGKQDEEVTNLHYDILEKANLVKPKISESQNDFPIRHTSDVERIKREGNAVSSDRKELERHAKELNSLLEDDTQHKIVVTPDGSVLPRNEANSKTMLEITLLENEIKVLEATIDKNKTLIEFLKLQLK